MTRLPRHPAVAVLAALLLPLLLIGGAARAAEPAIHVVAIDEVEDLKAVLATVESVDRTLARSRIGGTVEELAVDEGTPVREGERIARVRDPKLPLQLAALKARIDSVASQQKLAEVELKRARDLRRTGAGSQARLDDARTQLDVLRGQLAALKAEAAEVEEQLKEGDVLAPATGRVLHVEVTDGSVVLAGDQIAVIATETHVLRMHLPERHARFVAAGDRVLVGARGMDSSARDLTPGHIRQVYPELDNGRVVADVEVSGLGDFFVGERTRVYVATGTRKAIVIPESFVFTRFGVDFVRLENGDEVAVRLGVPTVGGIEVLAGLKPGDRLRAP